MKSCALTHHQSDFLSITHPPSGTGYINIFLLFPPKAQTIFLPHLLRLVLFISEASSFHHLNSPSPSVPPTFKSPYRPILRDRGMWSGERTERPTSTEREAGRANITLAFWFKDVNIERKWCSEKKPIWKERHSCRPQILHPVQTYCICRTL